LKKMALLVPAAIAVFAAVGCGGGGPTDPGFPPLEGTWTAIKAEYVSVAEPVRTVDIVAQGSTVTLVLSESTFNLSIVDPGEAPEVTVGSWTSSPTTLTLSPVGTTTSWVFTINQGWDTMVLSGAHVPYAFGGSPEEAILTLEVYQ
jgi:hypothetical protein